MQSKNGNCIVLGDFYGHVESLISGYEEVHGGLGWGIRNIDGRRLLEFADNFGMVVGNAFFKKDSEKLITFKYGGNSSVSHKVVVNEEVIKRVKDVKIIPSEECFLQHILLVMDLE